MRKVAMMLVTALAAALLSNGLSSVAQVNVIWVIVVALFYVDMESDGIWFAMLSGIIIDVMMHEQVGVTSGSILLGLGAYVLGRALNFGDRVWDRWLLVVLSFFLALLAQQFLRVVLHGGTMELGMFEIWMREIIRHTVLVGVTVYFLRAMERRSSLQTVVKI